MDVPHRIISVNGNINSEVSFVMKVWVSSILGLCFQSYCFPLEPDLHFSKRVSDEWLLYVYIYRKDYRQKSDFLTFDMVKNYILVDIFI